MSVFPNKQTFCRRMAMVFLVLILNELITPSVALALTGGPSQPEVHGFEPVGTSDMVDLSTGDFNYNIPLMDAGGYPINISYHAGASADDEGSWVGLGWSLTPGAMNRDMRGLPDDFKGDQVKKEFNIKEDVTTGVSAGVKLQFAGIPLGKIGKSKKKIGVVPSLGINVGGFMNSYKGFGIDYGVSPSFSIGQMSTPETDEEKKEGPKILGTSANLSTSLKYNSQSGLDADLSVGISNIGLPKGMAKTSLAANVGIGFSSRQGLKDLTFGTSLNQSQGEGKEQHTVSQGLGSGSINFASRTYVPTSAMPMVTEAQTFHGTVGVEAWTFHPNFQLTGYKSVQKLRQKTKQQAAYGYLNSQTASFDASALMDYNKEKQMPYRSSQPNLPLSVGTYDLFSAAGQGVSGQFRAMRNDVGTFRTPNHSNQSQSLNAGFELGLGAYAHGGMEIKNTDVSTVAGDWDTDKGAATHLTFTSPKGTADAAAYEPVFIKNTGESATSERADFRNNIGDNTPIALKLRTDRGVVAENDMRKDRNLAGSRGSLSAFSSPVKRDKREKRSQVFSYLTAQEAAKVGMDKTIKSYPNNTEKDQTPTKIPRLNHPAHHISEISVTQGDGSRYVYGIPAYNLKQEEATFAVPVPTNVNLTSLIDYKGAANGSVEDKMFNNCIGNEAGRDNYYDAQILPSFAHSYLLTGVVSADYVDIGNDGITDDDLGTNVKINYTKMNYTYNWRTPYSADPQVSMARHNAGYKNDSRDDKASYVYGEKEVWYTHSIETKTMIAKFFVDDREDGLGVQGRNGGKDESKRLKRLSKIELYSKSNLLAGNAIPIKTVHFEYDYSLCKGAPNITSTNTEGGKLTLRKIYFTYGKNTSGELNKYKFFYNGDVFSQAGELTGNNSFEYNIDNYDRWGSYKDHVSNLNNMLNKYFPYATQIKADADKYAKGWNLDKVELPSGGRIKITYEADDYAYVQDKRAGQMLPILGFSRNPADAPDNKLYDGGQSRFLHIDITAYRDKIANVADFKKRFLEDVNQIYFSCNVNLKDALSEDIKGYFDMDKDNIFITGGGNTAVIPMLLCPSGIKMNPIAKIALQTMRLDLPSLVYDDYEEVNPNASLKSILSKIGGILPEAMRHLRGFETSAKDKGWVKSVYLKESFVRLANPNYMKLGGGSRVKKIEVSNYASDKEGGRTNEPNDASYGQTYEYTTTNPDNNDIMSSGVASYEPMVGNEENLFREPVNYEEKIRWAPDNSYYMEKPFGESLFPSPNVVYSSVKVKSIEAAGLKRTGTGYTVHEFFTAKDFPTVVDYTTKQEESYNPNASFTLASFFRLDKRSHVGASQGYTIEVNDMHGKPKAEYVRREATPADAQGTGLASMPKYVDISWTKYDYRTSDPHHLKNDGVDVVNTEGAIRHDGTIGYDFDIWHDMQQDKTVTEASGMSVNTELFEIFGFPLFIPPIIPTFNRNESVFRSAVTTKFVKRFGILNKVTKMENGSTVSTENLLFDSETGQPLLTKTQNEFRDEMYQFSYPAHWAYDEGMGQAYKNIGLKATDVQVEAEGKVPNDFSTYFVPGDDLLVEQNGEILSNKYNIVLVGESKRIIDPLGDYLPEGTYSIKIIRSGRRNQASAAIGSVVSRKDPRQSTPQGETRLVFDNQILTAQAATFRDDWSVKSGKIWMCTKKDETGDIREDETFRALINALGARDVSEEAQPLAPSIGEIINDKKAEFLNWGDYVTFDELTPPVIDFNQATYTTYQARLKNECLLVLKPLNPALIGVPFSLTDVQFDNRNSNVITCFSPVLKEPIDIKITLICESCGYQCKDQLVAENIVNPYQLGIKGNWRPDAAHALYTPRTSPLSTTAKKLRTDGDVVGYENFWVYDTQKAKFVVNPNKSKWVKTNTITQYDDKGNDIENVDALNIYSSALFRYKNTLASAVAANAKLREIAFDGFEDYGFSYNFIEQGVKSPKEKDIALLASNNNTASINCGDNHFDFAMDGASVLRSNLSMDKAHTGKFSFKLDGTIPSFSRTIGVNTAQLHANEMEGTVVSGTDHRVVKRVLPSFGLSRNKSYLISAWLSKEGTCTPASMDGIKMKITMTYPDGSTSTMDCLPSGTIVEGWQRVETSFITRGDEPSAITIELLNKSKETIYMDDLRILPTDGKMKSFVYDARTLRLMAQLDENNYATFYEYDDEGTLVRTKRETERGIVTIQENRSTLYRKQSQ